MNLRTLCGNCRAAARWLLATILATAAAFADVDEVEFSVEHGFFETPFLLEFESDTDGATVRFTTDSSEPTLTKGQTYTRPLIINRTTVVRAAAFKAGEEPSEVMTQTYLFLADVVARPARGSRQTGETSAPSTPSRAITRRSHTPPTTRWIRTSSITRRTQRRSSTT